MARGNHPPTTARLGLRVQNEVRAKPQSSSGLEHFFQAQTNELSALVVVSHDRGQGALLRCWIHPADPGRCVMTDDRNSAVPMFWSFLFVPPKPLLTFRPFYAIHLRRTKQRRHLAIVEIIRPDANTSKLGTG